MPRRRLSFTERGLMRAMKAARKLDANYRFDVDLNAGTVKIIPCKPDDMAPSTTQPNPFDQWMASRARTT